MAVAEPLVAEETLSALIAALNQPDVAEFEAFLAERSAIVGGGPRWMSTRAARRG